MPRSDDGDRAERDGARGRRGRRHAPTPDDVRDRDRAVETLRAEPEPDWADAIRRGRDDRAARLRSVFASFDDEGADQPADEPADRPADQEAPSQ